MALTFPLSAAAFFDTLKVQEVRFSLMRQDQINGLGGGDILTAERAPAYWAGSVSLAPMAKRQAAEVEARLAWLARVNGSFHAYKAHQIGPASDPAGALAGSTPHLEAVDSDPHQIKIGGLAAGFDLRPGDFLAFDYDGGARRALHQLAEGGLATAAAQNGPGLTQAAYLSVIPYLRPGYALGAAVSLVRPSCVAVLVPGSVSEGITVGNVTRGMSFSFRQKLRA